MANVIIVYVIDNRLEKKYLEKVELVCSNVIPGHLGGQKCLVKAFNNTIVGLTEHTSAIRLDLNGVLLGGVFKEYADSWNDLTTNPDGSYGIFRWSNDYVELLSDIVSSRTIWYYHDENYFIASTSQRMIITFLGDYVANFDVFPWMMSAGSLGPFMSWDRRLKLLKSNTKLKYNKNNGSIQLFENPPMFKVVKRSEKEHRSRLKSKIEEVFSNIDFDYEHYYLPLSGGYDSRAILLNLKNKELLNTITWGKRNDENRDLTDASIARQLASHFKTAHEYMEIKDSEVSADEVLDRFIRNGEGRVDHINGYLDGFKLWDQLKKAGVKGLIRGDEGFGWSHVNFESNVTDSVGLSTLEIYKNLPAWFKNLYSEQEVPEVLQRKSNETIEGWRDRLYQQYFIPVNAAALTQLKTNYVEISNPLLTRTILNEVRTLPDGLRTEKQLFKDVVNSISPTIPYAKYASTSHLQSYLKRDEVVEIFLEKFRNNDGEIISTKVTDFLIKVMKSKPKYEKAKKESIVNKIKANTPQFVINYIKKSAGKNIDFNVLAFRVYIIFSMQEIIKEDIEKVITSKSGDVFIGG